MKELWILRSSRLPDAGAIVLAGWDDGPRVTHAVARLRDDGQFEVMGKTGEESVLPALQPNIWQPIVEPSREMRRQILRQFMAEERNAALKEAPQ